jgi:HEAT repeat protein
MAMRFVISVTALGALILGAGCAGGPEQSSSAKTTTKRKRTRSARAGALPDPLAGAIDIIPENRMTPEQLVDQCGDEDVSSRQRAHDLLLRMGTNANAACLSGLKSKNENIRGNCAHVLGLLGEGGNGGQIAGALMSVLDAAGDSPYVRQTALWALGRLRLHDDRGSWDKVGRKCFFYLNDSDTGVRSHAAESLRRQQYLPAVERLIALLDPSTAGHPANRLGQEYIRDALRDITFEDFGRDAGKWATWWSAAGGRVFGA